MNNYAVLSKNKIHLMVLFLIPMGGLGIDIYAPSLLTITHALHASHSLVKLTIVTYLIGYCLGQVIVGPLSDSYGRKPVLIAGLLLFSVFSYLATLSVTVVYLLVIRFLQGLTVTVPVVISKAILTDVFREMS